MREQLNSWAIQELIKETQAPPTQPEPEKARGEAKARINMPEAKEMNMPKAEEMTLVLGNSSQIHQSRGASHAPNLKSLEGIQKHIKMNGSLLK